jgi:predicted small secreted protein
MRLRDRLLVATSTDTWKISAKEQIMENLKKRFSALLILASLASVLATLGCNTIHGMGRDVERAGEKTQDAADSVKRRL